MAYRNKRYQFKVYDKGGGYITEWTDVVTDPSFDWPINGGVKDLTLRLARSISSFGEGSDVWFENELRIMAIDKEAPQGVQIYSGRLNEYRAVLDQSNEYVECVFVGYMTELSDRLVRDRAVADFTQSAGTTDTTLTLPVSLALGQKTSVLAMAFVPQIPNLSGFKAVLSSAVSTPQPVTVGIMYADRNYTNNQFVNNLGSLQPGNVIASGVIPANQIPSTKRSVNVNFSSTIYNLDITQDYFYFIAGSGINVYADSYLTGGMNDVWGRSSVGGAENRTDFGDLNSNASGWVTNLQFSSLYESTAPLYLSQDPSAVVTDVISNKQSGHVTMASGTLNTNASINYQVNKNTSLDVVNLMRELAPPQWYWYIDPTNQLHFQRLNETRVDHILSIGQHIKSINVVKSVNDLKTRVMLYGGSDVGTAELFYTDDRPTQQLAYTLKEEIVQDSRVIDSGNASLFTRSYHDAHLIPVSTIEVVVSDSSGDDSFGYDIESFIPGQRVLINDPKKDSYEQIRGTYDVHILDTDIADQTDSYLFATPLMIANIQYSPDQVTLSLANTPDDFSKRIQDISSNLVQYQTGLSPAI